MADNINITEGAGKIVAADEITGVLHQRVKIQIGADGEAADVDGGQQTMAASVPVTLASDQSDIKVTLDSELVDISDRAARDLGKVDIAAFDVALPAGANNIGEMDVPTATPTSYNVTLTTANTEYSQALPANCRFFEFQCRTEFEVRYAFVTGKVATPTAPYHSLKSGDYYFSPRVNQAAAPSTLYFASSTAGVIVEILAWV